jgi:hypothetical protein
VAQIPETIIDHVLDRVNDVLDSVRIQTRAIGALAGQMADQDKVLMAIHEAVTRESDNSLAKLLTEIAETGRTNTELLQRLLAKA